MKVQSIVFGAALSGLAFASAQATTFTTIDLTGVPNQNVAINAYSLPVGTTSGNQGTGIPVDIAPFGPNGYTGTWNAYFPDDGGPSPLTLTVPLTGLGISGQASFYALLNNYYGTPGADEYDITITATNSDTVTYQSIGGVDTRDYNDAVYSNTISNFTTPWFDNGLGQRLDIRSFALPAAFSGDTIASFTITQVTHGAYGDAALFSGLTFSDSSAVSFTPEPATWAIMLLGVGLTGAVLRRRATQAYG